MRWRQDRETGKLVEIVKRKPVPGVFIHVDDVDFISPVDGTRIRNSRELIDHNKRHGVSNDLDSLREQTARANEPVRLSKRERKDNIADAFERASSSGFSRRVDYED